jgi:RNA polymerase sigma-54 factor
LAKASASPDGVVRRPLAQRVDLRQKQRLGLTPAMRLGLRILALPTDLLAEEILREAEDNPCLIVEYRPEPPAFDLVREFAAAEESLSQSLLRQIGLQRLERGVDEAARLIVSELRADGFLDATLEELSADYGLTQPVLSAALGAVQACEPCGVGARSLAECLELQLRDAGLGARLSAQVVARLGDFAKGAWARIATALKISEAEAQRIGALLRSLNPHPVADVPDHLVPRVPEIVVERTPEGRVSVRLNPDALPRIALADIAGRLPEHTERARRIANAIAARQATLLRIAAAIVERQARFFALGEDRLDPLSRADLARALDLHASTVGRALSGKSLMFGGRVYPFSLFFSAALGDAEDAVSGFDAQRRIRALILAEDPEEPLADDEIRAQLMLEGVDIARRTVAKYRKCMRIPSSFERRRRKVSRAGRTQPGHGSSTP